MNVVLFGTDPEYMQRVKAYLDAHYAVERLVLLREPQEVAETLGLGGFGVLVLACNGPDERYNELLCTVVAHQREGLKVVWFIGVGGEDHTKPWGTDSLMVLNAQYQPVSFPPVKKPRPTPNPDVLAFRHNGVQYRIDCQSIVYIEVYYKTLHIVTEETVYTLHRCPLQRLMEALPPDRFVQCHRSFLVNRSKVTDVCVQEGKLTVELGSTQVPVGGRYWEGVRSLARRPDELDDAPRCVATCGG